MFFKNVNNFFLQFFNFYEKICEIAALQARQPKVALLTRYRMKQKTRQIRRNSVSPDWCSRALYRLGLNKKFNLLWYLQVVLFQSIYSCINYITQNITKNSYNLFVTSKKRNLKFKNLKCCKMSFKAFKMKKQGLKCLLK